MNTHHLHRLSFSKLQLYPPSTSLHSFVLVRNSLLRSIRTQQQEDSWLDACFDELTPDTAPNPTTALDTTTMTLMEDEDEDLMQHELQPHNDGIGNRHLLLLQRNEKTASDLDMLLLEEEGDDDDDDEGPVSPEQLTHYQSTPPPFDSAAYFISMDDKEDDGVSNTTVHHHHHHQHHDQLNKSNNHHQDIDGIHGNQLEEGSTALSATSTKIIL